MPSPFPGMDPYLEDPAVWPGFHHDLASEIMAGLNRLLLPAYIAKVEQRVYVSTEGDPGRRTIIPDAFIIPASRKYRPKPVKKSGGAAVLECEPVEVIMGLEEEVREAFVTIAARKTKQVVAVFEILSPTNKVPGSEGRQLYLAKREAVLLSQTHWIELDLLRSGEPSITPDQHPACEYTIHISRADLRPKATLWPVRLENSLPRIPIPLKGDDPVLQFELQPVFNSAYDRGGYAYDLDYSREPVPPLRPDLAKWTHKLLKLKKLRRA